MSSKKKVKLIRENKVSKVDNKVIWIIGGIVFIILAAGAIYFGTKTAENEFGNILSKKPIEPTPTIPDTKAHPPEPMETIPPRLSPEPTEAEPSIVPDNDLSEDVYLLPTSNSQKLTKEDLIDLTDLDLKKARNEIYARHGRTFVHKDMACYFEKQSWYKINSDYNDKLLSSLEISNAVFILNYEKERNSPIINTDTGCETKHQEGLI